MKRILIVDDKSQIRILLQAELEDEGYDVVVADGGRQALDKLNELDYEVGLVLLDIKMPDMNGLDVLNHIKQKKRDLPVILLSAYHTFKQDFSSWAAEDYVVKSSDLTELKGKIANFFS
ncbi:MAG TPA: response regulator [bacterium]|nr:response regulator [bacterium]